MRVAFLEVRDQIARLNSFIQEHISGISVVQLFNRQKRVGESFQYANEEHKKAHVKTIFYFSIFWPIVEVLASVAMALVVWYGGARALSGTVTFGVLLAFIQYVRQFFQPIRGISEKYNTLQSALASSERIFHILDTPSAIVSPEEPVHLDHVRGKIEFKNVWFRYDKEGSYILQDVSFVANPGELVAFVGATGAGKSTIINLVTRFYDIEKGEILFDGIDIRNLKLEDLRKQFALVLQDNALFSGTIEQNITLGNSEITQEIIQETAIEVGADTFISKLPDGYQTVLRERGASLSLGQRQLLCFVRAKVYDPKILILDEATSSIDSESEELISKACEKMMKDRTSIVIAHRLSTIQSADKIMVMHKGKIVESGTHEDLLELNGVYHRLYELQYQEQVVLSN